MTDKTSMDHVNEALGKVDDKQYSLTILNLALELINAANNKVHWLSLKDQAETLVRIPCEAMLEEMIFDYAWNKDEISKAGQILERLMVKPRDELLAVAKRRVKHRNKREHRARMLVEDMKLGLMMAILMDIADRVEDELCNELDKKHSGMFIEKKK